MSSNDLFISTNKNISSTEIINDYKNKYKKNNVKITKIRKSVLSKNNNEKAKIIAMNNLNNYQKSILQKVQKREFDKNKIYSFRDLNKNNIYIETEKEIYNNPKPVPMPIKINKNNKIDYNDIMQNSFLNKCIKNNKNNDTNKKDLKNSFNTNRKVKTINIEEGNYNKSSIMNNNKMNYLEISKEHLFIRNNKENNINNHINIDDKNKKFKDNKKMKEINNNKDIKLLFVLKNLDLEYLIDCFDFHCIKFKDLFYLKKQDFLEMNISIGPRNRIINFIDEYKIFAKQYDLNELKIFFKNNIQNEIIIDDYSTKNINKLKISYSEKDLNLKNNNKEKTENVKEINKYHSYYRNISNISNISIFNNYYPNNNVNGNNKNPSNMDDIKVNDFLGKDKNNNLFNKYNSMSDLLNINIPNKNDKIQKRNKIINQKNSEIFLTFNNDKNNWVSPIIKKEETKCDKNDIYNKDSMKSNKIKVKQKNIFNENNHHNKISEKKRKFYSNYFNINDEIKIFEDHLKEMREKSKETNTKVNNLLVKRKKYLYLEKTNQKFRDKKKYISYDKKIKNKNYNTLNNILEIRNNDKRNNGYYHTLMNSNKEKNIRVLCWNNNNN